MKVTLVKSEDYIPNEFKNSTVYNKLQNLLKRYKINLPDKAQLYFHSPIQLAQISHTGTVNSKLINKLTELFNYKIIDGNNPFSISFHPHDKRVFESYSNLLDFSNENFSDRYGGETNETLLDKYNFVLFETLKYNMGKNSKNNATYSYISKIYKYLYKFIRDNPNKYPDLLVQLTKTDNNEKHRLVHIFNLPLIGVKDHFLWYFKGLSEERPNIKKSSNAPNILGEVTSSSLFIFFEKLTNLLNCFFSAKFLLDQKNIYLLSVDYIKVPGELLHTTLNYYISKKNISNQKALNFLAQTNYTLSSKKTIKNNISLTFLSKGNCLGQGLVSGRVVFDHADILKYSNDEKILIKNEVILGDLKYIRKVNGIATLSGGITSHMSIIARSMGIVFISQLNGKFFNKKEIVINNYRIRIGDWITIDEKLGILYLGKAQIDSKDNFFYKNRLIDYSNQKRKNLIFANIDYSGELKQFNHLNFDGIGLCRSENQLIFLNLLNDFRCYLFASDNKIKSNYIDLISKKVLFELIKMLNILKGKPFHFRLIDPPISELLKMDQDDLIYVQKSLGISRKALLSKVEAIKKDTSIYENRGVRWGFLNQDFYTNQIDCVFESAIRAYKGSSITPDISILLPMVTFTEEIIFWKTYIDNKNKMLFKFYQKKIKITIGCMVETPRAALIIESIAPLVSCLAIGSNDLTQATISFNRNSFVSIFNDYNLDGFSSYNPFIRIDKGGVGNLIASSIKQAKLSNKKIVTYICGEHGSDINNLEWILDNGLDGVSCPPTSIEKIILKSGNIVNKNSDDIRHLLSSGPNIKFVSQKTLRDILEALNANNNLLAIKIAYRWAKLISELYGYKDYLYWKFFKRDIVINYFGKREYKRFYPHWKQKEVLEYIFELRKTKDTKVRYSFFPLDIACQATSKVFDPKVTNKGLVSIVDKFDRQIPMEIFPQQSESKMSFRTFYQNFVITVEAGFGQAINVFWKKNNLVEKISVDWEMQSRSIKFKNIKNIKNNKLKLILNDFIKEYGEYLALMSLKICEDTGLDSIALEGYYDFNLKKDILIVDIDLPIDIAFYNKK